MHSNLRVLLTGANGQLGQEFVHYFRSQKQGVQCKALRSKDADITDVEKMRSVISAFNPDVLINCAAYTKVDEAETDLGFKTAIEVNNHAITKLINLCKEFNIKLIHFSTDYVFDGSLKDLDIYNEESLPNPINRYGESKLLGDNELLSSDISYLIIRVAWLAGAYGWNFVRAIQKKIKTESLLKIVDDQVGTPSFAHDVVEKTWELVLRNQEGLFNIASANSCNRLEFAKEIVRQFGKGNEVRFEAVKTSDFASPANRPLNTSLSTKKLESVLGFPIKKWDVLLQECIHQMKEHPDVN